MWQEILKNLDQQDWYTEKDGWYAQPSDEAHRAARNLIIKNYTDEHRRMIRNTPRDGEFHDVGFKFLGEPVLFKKDETYRPVHRGTPLFFGTKEESYAYFTKLKGKVTQLKEEEANPPQKKRGFFSRGK